MPLDPRLWREAPIQLDLSGVHGGEGGGRTGAEAEARYLRALREGLMCFRRKLDTPRRSWRRRARAGLDVAALPRSTSGSHAIVEAFGADLEEARAPCRARAAWRFPTFEFASATGREWVFGARTMRVLSASRTGRRAPGRRGTPAPDVPAALGALRAHGHRGGRGGLRPARPTRATPSCGALAAEWRVKPERVLTG